jgi:hypothetical protein
MYSGPWKIKLKSTGLNEMRQMNEQTATNKLLGRQEELVAQKTSNTYKQHVFGTRQDNLAADAMAGQQDRLYGIQQRRIYGMDDDDDAYPEEGRHAIYKREEGGKKRKSRRKNVSRRKKRTTRRNKRKTRKYRY